MSPVVKHQVCLCILCSVILIVFGENKKVVVCFFTNWSQNRYAIGKFVPANVEADLCTHLFYAFAKVSDQANSLEPIELNYDEFLHPGILRLKQANPDLKLVLSVGGCNASQSAWLRISSPENVAAFSQEVMNYVRLNEFDGVDIDWEGLTADSASSYRRLVKALRNAFNGEILESGQDRLLLSTDVKANIDQLDFYDPSMLAKTVDYVIVMAYDFYGPGSQRLGHHSPLFLSKTEPPGSVFSQHQAIQMWINANVPVSKLILGLAAYGRSLLMSRPELHSPGDEFTGQPGPEGRYTQEKGVYAYYEICSKRPEDGWTEAFMSESRVPYMYNPNLRIWISFDNPKSMQDKTIYAVSRGLAGVMLWSLDSDDFHGTQCGQSECFALLKAINDTLDGTPRCTKDADCNTEHAKGACVADFCGCASNSFISSKKFCKERLQSHETEGVRQAKSDASSPVVTSLAAVPLAIICAVMVMNM